MLSQQRLRLRPSPWLGRWVAAWHLALLPAFYLTPAPWAFDVSYTLLVLLHCGYWCWRHLSLRPQDAVTEISYHHPRWRLRLNSGQWQDAELKPQSLFLPLLCVMHFSLSKGSRVLWLGPDSADPDGLRRLRLVGRLGQQLPADG